MNLFDSALQKAYGQDAAKAKPSGRRGPHFKTPPSVPREGPNERELFVTEDGPLPESSEEAGQAADSRPGLPEMPPIMSFEPSGEPAPSLALSRIDNVDTSADQFAATRWLSLFRHEVSTDHPDLYDWHLPLAERPNRTLPRIASVWPQATARVEAAHLAPDPTHMDFADDEKERTEVNEVRYDSGTVDEVDAEADQEEAIKPPATFRPSWEVDRFKLTEVCDRVERALADYMQMACEQVIHACSGGRRVVTIGSWGRGEGRTTVSVVLARALAAAGQRVVLVDGDFENPRLAESLGLAAEGGTLGDIIDCDSVATNCVYSLSDRVTFLPFASISAPNQDRSRSLDDVVELLQQHFEIVIVDLPPGRSDACHAAVGLRVLVRSASHTTEETLSRWVSRLENLVDVPVKIIENFTEQESGV